MVKKTTNHWVISILSAIIALIATFSRPVEIGSSSPYLTTFLIFIFWYAIFCVIIFVTYWAITRVYPKSQNWGIISWIFALIGTSIIITFALALLVTLIPGGTGSSLNSNQTNQSSQITILQPDPTIIPTNVQPEISTQPNPTPISTVPSLNQVQSITPIQTNQATSTKADQISRAIDYLTPTVKNFANRQIQQSSSGTYNTAQICDVWQSIYNQWTYVSDPPDFNYFTSASDSINNGLKGNCVDYAILNAAVIESIGGSSRVVTACPPDTGQCHAYAEVYLDSSPSELQKAANYICSRYNCKTINYHMYLDPQGNTEYWLNLDWQANYPGGSFFQDNGTIQIYYPNGYHYTSKTT